MLRVSFHAAADVIAPVLSGVSATFKNDPMRLGRVGIVAHGVCCVEDGLR